MAFVDLTKQLAQQALQSAMSDPPPASPSSDNAGAVMLNQIGAMQKALKEDEEPLEGEAEVELELEYLQEPEAPEAPDSPED